MDYNNHENNSNDNQRSRQICFPVEEVLPVITQDDYFLNDLILLFNRL